MAKLFKEINEKLKSFLEAQKIFFVGTAADEGRVNISPKGMDSLRVINSTKLVWLNLTGSGNETAAHLLKSRRMTIMFCSFEEKPMILRLYGNATIFHSKNKSFEKYIGLFPKIAGARQIIEMDIDLVQTSCGFAVPIMDFKKERTQLKSWAEKEGEKKIEEYWQEKNTLSIDDFETGIMTNKN